MPRNVRFGIFDWLDDSGRPLADHYSYRLQAVELADRLPFWCYHVAEHHGTPLGLAPSPHLFLAAAAARTERIRLGPLVDVLPLHDPVRVVEEVCMLDHLSRGRLELGVGRGGVPGELALYGVAAEETREMFREALQVVLEGLRSGRFDHEGRYYRRRGVSTPLRPLQKPYPPLWYPTSFPSSVEWIAQEGMSVLFAFLLARQTQDPAGETERYRRIWEQNRHRPDRLNGHVGEPCFGHSRHVVVAESDREAVTIAREALRTWFDSFNHLWLEERGEEYYPSDVDAFFERGYILAGSPATVRGQVQRLLDQLGGNYFVGVFSFGNLPADCALRSLDLFGREVIPGLLASGSPDGRHP